MLCLDDDGPQLRNRIGSPIPNFDTASPYRLFPSFAERFAEGGPYAVLNRTTTDTQGYGATLQASNRVSCSAGPIASSRAPASTAARRDFTRLDRDRRPHPRPRIRRFGNRRRPAGRFNHAGRRSGPNAYYGLYFSNVLDVTDRLSATCRRSLQPGAGQHARPDRHCAQRRPDIQPVQSGRRVWPTRSRPRSASTAGIRKRTGRRHRPNCRARIRPPPAA